MKFASIVAILSLVSSARALDLEVTGYSCENLPVKVKSLHMTCGGGEEGSSNKICTFGEDVELSGYLTYSGVESSGIQYNLAYAVAEMKFWTASYSLFDMQPVQLCYGYEQEGEGQEAREGDEGDEGEPEERRLNENNQQNYYQNQYACPGDGTYPFEYRYTLPSAGNSKTSWFSSGWNGQAVVEFYAEPDVDGMLIGRCYIDLQTHVTTKNQEGQAEEEQEDFLFGLPTPSAAVAAGLALGVAALMMLCCLYCYCRSCCCPAPRARRTQVQDEGPRFRRMEESQQQYKRMDDVENARNNDEMA